MKFDVITFGSGVVDIFLDTDVPQKGKFLAYPAGSKILLKNVKFDIGGGGTNTAVAFSRLGLKTGWIGKVGDDNYGDSILDLLKDEKIKFLGKVEKGGITGNSIILDSREHNRTILTYKGVNDELTFKDIKLKKIKTKWLYYSSMMGSSLFTQKRLAQELVKLGTKLAFNPSEYLIKKENLKALLEICEVLIVNKEEAQLLTKKKDLLLGLHALGPKIVVITDRNKSIKAYDGKKKYSLKPNKVKVVERTGAGDAFASGFVAGLIARKSIKDCMKLGLKEGESVIRHFGAKNKLLRLKL